MTTTYRYSPAPTSTQNREVVTTDDILDMYPEETGDIPDDTIDKVMAELNVPSQQTYDEQVTEEPDEEEEAVAASAGNTNQELKDIVPSLKAKLDKTELNVLNSQIEI